MPEPKCFYVKRGTSLYQLEDRFALADYYWHIAYGGVLVVHRRGTSTPVRAYVPGDWFGIRTGTCDREAPDA